MTFYVVAADKDVDVLADLALFVEYAVTKGKMLFPERIQGLANIGEITGKLHLDLAVRERLEMAAKMNCYRHFINFAFFAFWREIASR